MRFGTLALSFVVVGASPLQRRTELVSFDPHPIPQGWERGELAPDSHTVPLRIGLTHGNFAELEIQLAQVSDPLHEKYGQHLSREQVHALLAPKPDTLALVKEWLASHEIMDEHLSSSPAGDYISVRLPVRKVEEMLDTRYHRYHKASQSLVRTHDYKLPHYLHEHISVITPTNYLHSIKAKKSTVRHVSTLSGFTIPKSFSWPFSLPNFGTPDVSKVCNTSAVTNVCLPGYKYPVVQIAGGPNQQTPDTPAQLAAFTDLEANLDSQTIGGFDFPTPLTVYSTGGEPPFIPDDNTGTDNSDEPYGSWASYFLGLSSPPQVVSTSYGDDEQNVPLAYAKQVCSQFAAIGARGTTLFFASGDSGVESDGPYCTVNDGSGRTAFLPSFPPTCPYITTVGATKNFAPEVAAYDPANGFYSGAGLSNYFAAPSYQKLAVDGYFAQAGNIYAGKNLYNRSGRAYPDISAQGQSFLIYWDGQQNLVDGTSASTPTAAAIFALINDRLIVAGRPVLGFANPLIYSLLAPGFNDITSGASVGCGTQGFPAKIGWDLVTGFGTPDFSKLSALLGLFI
ncbi:uncharacterized protein L969DRAFT_95084 [Mixia osmundae IAM 14324]|uniref:tripeptidyl-peptidase II n=1 Tax=Mixia osmundae (strain CBS 9802 / IAM 14324 / JCM 22182 / KY 12970) TaxID=764103 RepID=G7E7F3_MIXOS|nr:uncharacterized protein L969DRAFT_95084 [Mixia osmundae IAM 14324]KEI38923.1 hypothetical protein L969DRAFT_95084 [Mixia osmundae IAM 14324]GAA98763.1 hypothetical protein E5Q_05451 [Mixia osmundae IAM 14324]